MTDRHPSITGLLRWFDSSHLRDDLKGVIGACEVLAKAMVENITIDDPELSAGLRKLVEAKDCFVRAAVRQGEQTAPAPTVTVEPDPNSAATVVS